MSCEVILKSGGNARILESDGDKTTIESPEAFPPGSTVLGAVDGVSAEFHLKVKSCKRQGETFRIEGRLRNATREMKARVQTSG